MKKATIHIVPARLGNANNGSYCGLGLLNANNGPGDANANYGVSLKLLMKHNNRYIGEIGAPRHKSEKGSTQFGLVAMHEKPEESRSKTVFI